MTGLRHRLIHDYGDVRLAYRVAGGEGNIATSHCDIATRCDFSEDRS